MPFDAAYEPVIVGNTLLLASSRTDSVAAYDTRSGKQLWRWLSDGPVRFAPTCVGDKAYVVSDDGYLYCLSIATGEVRWKFQGGPSDRKILGNGRLISMWPARGAPVVADGTVYFAASIWPFMGVFIHAVNAETGRQVWTNDGDGSLYIKQPHSADSFAGVAPQGPMGIRGDYLLVPGGRSVPAVYDRKTGKLVHFMLNENSKKGGGHSVTIAGDYFFNGQGIFHTATGKSLGEISPQVAVAGSVVYAMQNGEMRSYDLAKSELKSGKLKLSQTGAVKLPGVTNFIIAGNQLVAGFKDRVVGLNLPLPTDLVAVSPTFEWEQKADGTVTSLAVADDRLFVSVKEGRVICFGAGGAQVVESAPTPEDSQKIQSNDLISAIVNKAADTQGYAVVWQADAATLRMLMDKTTLEVVAFHSDPSEVRRLRLKFIESNHYGERISVLPGEPGTALLPSYFSNWILAEKELSDESLIRLYQSVRPFGGRLVFATPPMSESRLKKLQTVLPGSKFETVAKDFVEITREGPLPGSANWTHEHADAGNTRVSKDSLVKAPLGLLWFGGTSNEGILPRHGHGPQPQVVDGRIIIEGMDKLRATDLYTGRLLWESPLPGLGDFYDNLSHQPGANSSGTNYISTSDGIYVNYKTSCWKLDPVTGKKLMEFTLPKFIEAPSVPRWGYINVIGDYLIGGADPLLEAQLLKQERSASKLLKLTENDDFSASRYLAVLDRHTGKLLWTASARFGFRHNAICAGNGKLFVIDRLSGAQVSRRKQNGESPVANPRAVAFDLKTGKELWGDESETFGTWLSYSEKYDILVEAGRVARDTLSDEPKGMRAYRGTDGKELWYEKNYVGPAMLHGDTILRGQGACDLLTGKPKMRRDPITDELEEWVWSRNYGCNTPMASEHLMTFRSGAAGFYDLCHDGGTGNFGGFRSSCTNNLVVAGGVLCAPDYTRTCTCSYQNQTSICMVPMHDAEEWTFYGKSGLRKTVKRVGINFGAPGDRKANDGTLWLEYPSVGGASPAVPVHISGRKMEYFRKHQTSVTGEMPWVGCSGVRNIESLAVKLLPDSAEARHYTVRLIFAEVDDIKSGDRVFDVTVQGRRLLDDFDIFKAAGGRNKVISREFRNIRVEDELRLSFRSGTKLGAVLGGIEILED
ncbi:outer membrane protein assembly factor BamB family protein [Zavarzinella formosa]|uniref:outer membrane protein assembly factor BamB family protein n=1 Tax=Zavarzinella formosa TaxID=360055 RepID=UPI00030AD0A4|nr:PQQ-binding-like beta-propeller repeat protein [Zavarzinella formosa]